MADYNSDWMSRRQDEELEELEKRLSALYAQASREVTEEFTKFTEEFAEQEARMLELLAVGKIDDDDFRIWRNNHILQSVRYQSLIKTLTDMMVDTDNSAMAIVSGELPFVIAQSYNFMQALGWDAANQAGYSAGTFTIYNASAVQALIRDNPDLLPSVDNPIDEAWNMSHITREITQGILQGNTMPQIADRLRRVVGMDENAAMRNARTSFTYAENMGRNESIENLQSRGIPMEKVWSAVMDNRTRQTHRLLNGTTPDKATGLYGVGFLAHPLRFPADKSGDAEEIYNCRCRLSGQLDSSIVDHSNDDELYEQFLRENYPNDYQALLDRDYFNQHTSKPLPRPEVAKPVKPTFEKATNREEALKLLNDIGFNDVSSRAGNMDEALLVNNANRLAELSSKYESIPEGMALTMEAKTRSANAYVRYQWDGNMTALNLNGKAYTGVTDETFVARVKGSHQPSIDWLNGGQERKPFLMPTNEDNLDVYTITHEYGHILQGTYIFSDDYRAEYNSMIASGLTDASKKVQKHYYDRVHEVSNQQRIEIIEIAVDRNPYFDLSENISRYGMSDSEEFFAECFANAHCGKPNELGEAMLEWLRRQGYET